MSSVAFDSHLSVVVFKLVLSPQWNSEELCLPVEVIIGNKDSECRLPLGLTEDIPSYNEGESWDTPCIEADHWDTPLGGEANNWDTSLDGEGNNLDTPTGGGVNWDRPPCNGGKNHPCYTTFDTPFGRCLLRFERGFLSFLLPLVTKNIFWKSKSRNNTDGL